VESITCIRSPDNLWSSAVLNVMRAPSAGPPHDGASPHQLEFIDELRAETSSARPEWAMPTPDQPERQSTPGHAIGLDVGGTKIAAGIVSATGEVFDQQVLSTPAGDKAAIFELIVRIVTGLRERHPEVEAVGVGASGWVEWPNGKIRFSPYIAYQDLPLRQLLEDDIGLPVVVDNDANAAAWAESRFGAGKGVSDMLLLTIGTGIGGGLIVNGEVYRGHNGLGGEVGHLIVKPGGERCGCGNLGCFETMASGTALGREARKVARSNPTTYLARLAGGSEAVTGETVTGAAQVGDQVACALLEQTGFWCGLGAASLVAILDPALIVITGGLAVAGELLLAPMRASLEEHLYARGRRCLPTVVVSPLGTDAGLIGAGSLALHALHG
jgi:glucokinase